MSDANLDTKITLERVVLSLESIADSLEKLVELMSVRAAKRIRRSREGR